MPVNLGAGETLQLMWLREEVSLDPLISQAWGLCLRAPCYSFRWHHWCLRELSHDCTTVNCALLSSPAMEMVFIDLFPPP